MEKNTKTQKTQKHVKRVQKVQKSEKHFSSLGLSDKGSLLKTVAIGNSDDDSWLVPKWNKIGDGSADLFLAENRVHCHPQKVSPQTNVNDGLRAIIIMSM